jgi:excisionase family DNA binding protein
MSGLHENLRATMTAKPAAKYIGISYWKLLELAKAGRVPHVRIDGRILFRRESLDQWLAAQEQASLKKVEPAVRGIRRLK